MDAGHGRGRGLALLEKLKKAKGSSDESTPSPGSAETSSGEPSSISGSSMSLGGRGVMAMLAKKQVPGATPSSSSQSSSETRAKGLKLLENLKAMKAKMALATDSSSDVSGVTQQLSDTTIHSTLKPKDKYFREVKETPPVVMRGSRGSPLQVTANFIRLHFKENCVFEYEVRFQPDQDYMNLRYKLLNQHNELWKVHTFDGTTLYLPISLPEEVTSLSSKNPFDDTTVQLTITFRRTRRLSEMVHIYNVLFKQIMKDLKLVRFNRQHFNEHGAITIPQHQLQVWPGYVTAVDEYEGGLMLTLDSTHRVLRTQSVLNYIKDSLQQSPANYKAVLVENLVGYSVMTSYNKKLYRVDSIDFNSSPMSTFEKIENGVMVTVTYVDYYKKNYGINIMDFNQPMLISKKSKKIPGASEPADFMFSLVPELCQMTGLTEEQRKDFHLMKDVATYTRVTPNQRHAAFKQYIKNVLSNDAARNRLAGWGLSVAPDTIQLAARTLPPETLSFGGGHTVSAQEKADWRMEITRNSVLEAVDLNKWIVFYQKRDERTANDFVETMLRCGPPMGISMARPSLLALPSDSSSAYISALKGVDTRHTQLVVIICPNSRDDRYAAIKKICCADNAIPSQVINARTLKNQSKIRSITQNIALQINCKLGGTLWSLNIPLKSTMIVGVDSYHDPVRKNNSVCGFVASYNPQFTKWYSRVFIQEKGQEIVDGLKACLTAALTQYMKYNDHLPDKVVMYRDGVGDGQLKILQEYEIPQLKVCFRLLREEYRPALTCIVVQKRINTRIFKTLNSGFENPPPGTIVDHDITRRDWYDFLIVSQKVNQGTVSPSHYVVVSDDSNTTPDIWQRLTYKLCHLYYNWPGTVRVPAPCQYAHRLAGLVGSCLHTLPAPQLSDKLFFL